MNIAEENIQLLIARDRTKRRIIGAERYETLIANGPAIGSKYDGLYWIVDQNRFKEIRETLLNRKTGEIISEIYIPERGETH